MKNYLRLCLFLGIFSCCLLPAKTAMWTAGGIYLGKIDLQGSLSQQYNLGYLGPVDAEVFPVQLVHKLSPYPLGSHETFSKWQVPQLTLVKQQ